VCQGAFFGYTFD
jgi:hypothetical protein